MSTNSARRKLERARSHVSELGDEIASYRASNPFVIEQTENAASELKYVLRILRPIPDEWASIIGDAVHNYRAALDHVCWTAVSSGGGTPTNQTAFPFARAAANLKDVVVQRLKGASDTTHRLARRLKPYDGGNSILWDLHQLDIVDKHRQILIAGCAHRTVNVQIRMPGFGEDIVTPPIGILPADRQFPLKDGDVLFSVCAQARIDNANMEEPTFTIDFAFDTEEEVAGKQISDVLSQIDNHVERILELFDRYVFNGDT